MSLLALARSPGRRSCFPCFSAGNLSVKTWPDFKRAGRIIAHPQKMSMSRKKEAGGDELGSATLGRVSSERRKHHSPAFKIIQISSNQKEYNN
ncbi:MAG: hypothetical protein G01um101420_786 [Parcubacteria group bacterium Gr01-1014_20]|nr:MAG: hypothetical protein G01um101420_786 [Parcubacteria group bacterium Gr01-1014_20]